MLSDAGYEAYIAGGAVRDALRGVPIVDIDIATSATPEQVLEILAEHRVTTWDIGSAFGTIGAKLGGEIIEVTTYRSEAYTEGSRHPEVRWSSSAADDMVRRDLTINSMFLSADGTILDLYGGRDDLAAGVIRATGDPDTAFTDDPLRIVRTARFAATLEFTVEAATLASAIAHGPLLSSVSKERLLAELTKAFTAGAAPTFAAACIALGVDDVVFGGFDGSCITSSDADRAWTELARSQPSDNRQALLSAMTCPRRQVIATTRSAAIADWADDHPGENVDLLLKARALEPQVATTGLAVLDDPWARNLVAKSAAWLWEPLGTNGNDVRAQGFEGPAIGARLAEIERQWVTDQLG